MKRGYRLWRRIAKLLAFLVFALGTIPTALGVLPLLKAFVHPRIRFQKAGRRVVSWLMGCFLLFLRLTGQVSIQADRAACRRIHGMLIAPNHPSLLDVVILYHLFPGSSCVVRSGLGRTIVGSIIALLYIPNDDAPAMLDAVEATLDAGDNVIIFPEGTRTADPRHLGIKRGTGMLACLTGRPILPVSILGNDKTGLKKHDPPLAVNSDGPWRYRIEPHPPIEPAKEGNLRTRSQETTRELQEVLQGRLDAYDKEHA